MFGFSLNKQILKSSIDYELHYNQQYNQSVVNHKCSYVLSI